MPRTHPSYLPEYRFQIVELVRAVHSPEDLACAFEPTRVTIRSWVKQADLDEGHRQDGLTMAEREEIVRLLRENKVLRLEPEILGKATAWFARETGSIPSESSSS